MNKAEFQKLTGKSPTQTRKLCDKGEFIVSGFGRFKAVKTGKGRTCPIDIRCIDDDGRITDETIPAPAMQLAKITRLREAKLAVDIQVLQQRLLEKQETIERNYAHEIVSVLMSALEPLKTAFRKCRLTKEQSGLINAALNESLKRAASFLNR